MNILPFDHLFKPAPVKTIKDINPGEVFVWDNADELDSPMLKLGGNNYVYLHGIDMFDASRTNRFGHKVIRLRHSLHIEGIEP